jgi:hypothetical protein
MRFIHIVPSAYLHALTLALLVMMAVTQRLPVPSVPHQLEITTVGYDVVHQRRDRGTLLSFTGCTVGVLSQPLSSSPSPFAIVPPTGCATPLLLLLLPVP